MVPGPLTCLISLVRESCSAGQVACCSAPMSQGRLVHSMCHLNAADIGGFFTHPHFANCHTWVTGPLEQALSASLPGSLQAGSFGMCDLIWDSRVTLSPGSARKASSVADLVHGYAGVDGEAASVAASASLLLGLAAGIIQVLSLAACIAQH